MVLEFWFCLPIIYLSTRPSFAKIFNSEKITSGKSLMHAKNRIGAKCVPCGIPEPTVFTLFQKIRYPMK